MLTRTVHGRVAVLTLQHGKANALDLEFCGALARAFEAEARSPERALVLTGSGSIFSAGVDLRRVLAEGEGYARGFLPALHAALTGLFALEKPCVAALNGHAVAGGAILAWACERRIMTSGKATMGAPELRVGVPFPTAALEVVRSALAPSALDEVLFLGRTYDPEECLRRGFVDELAVPGEVLSRALATAEELAAIPSAAYALNKRMRRAPHLERIAARYPIDEPHVLEAWISEAGRAALGAYVERTLPRKPA